MTQGDATAECRRLEDVRTAARQRLQDVRKILFLDADLCDTWWPGLYDAAAQEIRDVEAAMAAAGCPIGGSPPAEVPAERRERETDAGRMAECARLAGALNAALLRLDAARTVEYAAMEAGDRWWPPSVSSESIEREIRDIETAMALANCAVGSRTAA